MIHLQAPGDGRGEQARRARRRLHDRNLCSCCRDVVVGGRAGYGLVVELFVVAVTLSRQSGGRQCLESILLYNGFAGLRSIGATSAISAR